MLFCCFDRVLWVLVGLLCCLFGFVGLLPVALLDLIWIFVAYCCVWVKLFCLTGVGFDFWWFGV